MMTLIQVTTTCSTPNEATNLANLLRKTRLVASVHLNRILSFYTYNNSNCIKKEIEVSCITLRSLYDDVEKFIKENHSYECPQIISTRIDNVSEEFADWVKSNVKVPTGLKFED